MNQKLIKMLEEKYKRTMHCFICGTEIHTQFLFVANITLKCHECKDDDIRWMKRYGDFIENK